MKKHEQSGDTAARPAEPNGTTTPAAPAESRAESRAKSDEAPCPSTRPGNSSVDEIAEAYSLRARRARIEQSLPVKATDQKRLARLGAALLAGVNRVAGHVADDEQRVADPVFIWHPFSAMLG